MTLHDTARQQDIGVIVFLFPKVAPLKISYTLFIKYLMNRYTCLLFEKKFAKSKKSAFFHDTSPQLAGGF